MNKTEKSRVIFFIHTLRHTHKIPILFFASVCVALKSLAQLKFIPPQGPTTMGKILEILQRVNFGLSIIQAGVSKAVQFIGKGFALRKK